MEMKYVKYFLEIAKQKSLSKAAEYLFVSQPTLSQFLTKEEQELGVKLFIRNKNEMSLTVAGQLYAQACKDILDRKQRLYKDLSDIAYAKTGQIRVGITPQWGAEMFAEILPVFRVNYPGFLLKSTENSVKPLVQYLLDGKMDMAVLALYEKKPISLPQTMICREEFVLAVPNDLKNNKRTDTHALETVPVKEFKKSGFIVSCTGTTIRDIQNEILYVNEVAPEIICEINSMSSTLKMVASGLGVSIVPRSYVNDNPRIMFYKLKPSWYWNICIVCRRGFVLNAAARYLIQLITDYFSKLVKE